MNELRKNNFRLAYAYPPEILSRIMKIFYIYEMDDECEDLDELVQTLIMKHYIILKNVKVEQLIEVIKDFALTRKGSRELYIFL